MKAYYIKVLFKIFNLILKLFRANTKQLRIIIKLNNSMIN